MLTSEYVGDALSPPAHPVHACHPTQPTIPFKVHAGGAAHEVQTPEMSTTGSAINASRVVEAAPARADVDQRPPAASEAAANEQVAPKEAVVPDPPAKKAAEKVAQKSDKKDDQPFGKDRNDQGGKLKPNDPNYFCPQHLPESKKGIDYWER